MQLTSSIQLPTESLWDFSLALYAQPGVADCCLQLQDEHGVNVNVLLWCVWLGVRGYELDQAQLDEALDSIQGWHSRYVQPLRALRRQMKLEFGVKDEGVEAVRTSIKQAELQAERQLQFWLEQRVDSREASSKDGRQIVSKNIQIYLLSLGMMSQVITRVDEQINSQLWRKSASNLSTASTQSESAFQASLMN
jgi:uncharacterized protein (TIGR02444 family)